MNTTKTGMRTVLAAAAAGALVVGSAAGVMAKPNTPNGPKPGSMQVRMVDVHNGPFNVAKPRTVKVKANVWDSVKGAAPSAVKVTFAQFDKRAAKGGKEVADDKAVIADLEVNLTTKSGEARRSKNFTGSVSSETILALLSVDEKADLAKAPVLLCISKVDLVDGTEVKPSAKHQVIKKIGNDCFRVVNVPVAKE